MPSVIFRKVFRACLLAMLPVAAHGEGLTFSGCSLPALTADVPPSSGLTAVYVLAYTQGVTAQYESASGARVSWQRFSNLGGGYAQDVASTQSGNVSTLTRLEPNMGYIVTDGTKSSFFWVIDHSAYPIELNGIALSGESDCLTAWLSLDGTGEVMTCYGITGMPCHINRDFTLTYQTLEFDPASFAYVQVEHTESLEALAAGIHCDAPLCQTDFTLSGDRFAREWGEERSVTSPVYDPVAVSATTAAVQTLREADNEVREEANLGGSGPVEITFSAAVTDAALYHQWELARDSEFNQTFLRYSDLEFQHTFREQGTTYVRLVAANDVGACEFVGETYEVFIGQSSLQCPNAFSPGASEGVNDEWKVSYKSIIEFDCRIFDNQGRCLAHLTNPAQGWNGRRNGKLVPAGVYYYVIRAKGTDGKNYKLAGDINIIGFKRNTTTSSGNATE